MSESATKVVEHSKFIYSWEIRYRHAIKGFGRSVKVDSPTIEGALHLGQSELANKYDDYFRFEAIEVLRRAIVGRSA